MRIYALFVLYVSLAKAGDWKDTTSDGLAAAARQDYGKAAVSFQESLALAQTPREHAIAASNLAILDRFTGDYVSAEALARSALANSKSVPEIRSTVLNTLADLLREEGRKTEARSLFEEALGDSGASWIEHLESLSGLANIDNDPARWQQAVQLARDRQDPVKEAAGLRGLGETWIQLQNPQRAEPLLRQALAILESTPAAGGHQSAAALTILGQIYLRDDRVGMAEDVLMRALSIEERTLGANHPQVALLHEMLGDACARLNQRDRWQREFDRAQSIMTSRFGDNSPEFASVLINRAAVEQRARQTASASASFQKALAILEVSGEDLSSLRHSVIDRYAQLLKATHRGREVRALLAEAKSFREK